MVLYNSVFVPLCSPKTCKDVFNPNITTFQSNCAEGLHFSAFHLFGGIPNKICYLLPKGPVVQEVRQKWGSWLYQVGYLEITLIPFACTPRCTVSLLKDLILSYRTKITIYWVRTVWVQIFAGV